MKKKRIFKRILVFIAVLVGTLGICAVSGSIAKAASTDTEQREYLFVNEGFYTPLNSEPQFTGLDTGPLNIPFTFYREDPNSGEFVEFKSIRINYESDLYTVYFSTSATSLSVDSVMVASSNVGDWLTSVSIRVVKEQRLENTAGYEFLVANFGSIAELKYLVSGRYEFNDGVFENSFGAGFSATFDLRGYFVSPLEFTGEELHNLYGFELSSQHLYYVHTFKSLRIVSNASGITEFAFEVYVPAVNQYVFLNVYTSPTDTISDDYMNARVVVFDGYQYIDSRLFNFLDNNGYFGSALYEPTTEYTPTDLIFAVVDAPIRFIQSLLSFELFGITFFLVFGSIITLTIGLWIIFKKG